MLDRANTPKTFRFGPFEADLQTQELFKNSIRLRLAGQPFGILSMLLHRPGQLVTREELRSELWSSDIFVDFDHGLNAAMNKLRECLNDTADDPKYIETLPRRGYRFIARVESSPAAQPMLQPAAFTAPQTPTPPPPVFPNSRRHSLLVLVSLFLAAAVLLAAGWLNLRKSQVVANAETPKIHSLAVLPLVNLSGDPAQEFLADGMTEELITDLGKSHDLRVISRTSVMQYKGAKKPLQEIARELNVDALLEGTVIRSGNHVRITANLVRSSPEAHLWAETYESENGDLLGLQHQVANSVAEEIKVTLTPRDARRVGSINPKAQDLYIRGKYALMAQGSGSDQTAIEYLRGAIDADPSFADAYANLAMAYAIWLPGAGAPRDTMPLARQAALKAISLDNSVVVGHMALAFIDMNYDWNFPEAEREFKLALQNDPNDGYVRGFYARELVILGRTDEALLQARRVMEVQPYGAQDYPAFVFYLAHRYNESLEIAQRMVGFIPNNPWGHLELAANYEQLGRQKEAVDEFLKFEILSGSSSQRVKRLQEGFAKGGVKGYWQASRDEYQRIAKSGYAPPVMVAATCMRLNDLPCALQWLDRGVQERDYLIVDLTVDPVFTALHSNPHFQQILQRVGLPH